MNRRVLISVVPLLLMVGACGDSDETSSSDTAGGSSDGPQLTFTGSDCVYAGPSEVTAGVVSVEFVNDSDGLANISVALLDEGKTVQNVIDVFEPEPYTGTPPTWMADMGGQSPASAGETISWESSLAAGEYVTWCARRGNHWVGAGFTVIDG